MKTKSEIRAQLGEEIRLHRIDDPINDIVVDERGAITAFTIKSDALLTCLELTTLAAAIGRVTWVNLQLTRLEQ